MELLAKPPTGKKKRTEDRLAGEAQKLFEASPAQIKFVKVNPADLEPAQIYRAQRFLNRVARHPEPLPMLYTTMLRGFLERLGIDWVDDVFKYHPGSPGSGRTAATLGQDSAELRATGKTWGEVAKKLLPLEYEINRRPTTDKVRLAADRYLRRKTHIFPSGRRKT